MKNLIEEAKKRGYKAGTIIDYEGSLTGTDTLGDGEFAMKDGKLIKYVNRLENDHPLMRQYDTIWDEEDGWTKIVNEKHGFAL